MKRPLTTIILLLMTEGIAMSQLITPDKKLKHSIHFGVARSTFKVSGILTEKYPTIDFQTGWELSKPLTPRIQIKSGINLYFKGRRKSYFVNGSAYYGNKTPILLLDETTSKKYHCSFDIPLRFEYSFFNFNSSINAGILGRLWQPTNLSGDVLRSQKEIGYLLGARQKISSRFILGVDFYFGLSRLVRLPINSGYYTVRQNYMQAKIGYSF